MKLEHAINWSILNYPTLYRMKTHAESRLKVLDHFFLCIGTGMDWRKEGYLADLTDRHPEKKVVKQLPKGFYEMELFQVDIDPKMLKEAKQELKDNKVWFNVRKSYFGTTITFTWSRELALPFVIKYECEKDRNQRAEYSEMYKDIPGIENPWATRLREANAREHPFNPYPMCEYSALIEMVNKRTNSPHIENFDLTFVLEDWIQGAIEVAKAALAYYNDEAQYSNNYYHPNKCLWNFQEDYDKDPEDFERKNIERGFPPKTSVKDTCLMCFEQHRAKQIDYCNRFLQMYAPDFPQNQNPVV
jgi:hypothetical protein